MSYINMAMLVGLVVCLCNTASAGEFRTFQPIAQPGINTHSGLITHPVKRQLVESAVRDILAAWGSSGLNDKLADGFYDSQRLIDAVARQVPRDASLRVLAIEGIQTLSQQEMTSASGAAQRRSVVSATVRTQLEFNDPNLGFQRREGTNELLLEVIETPGQ